MLDPSNHRTELWRRLAMRIGCGVKANRPRPAVAPARRRAVWLFVAATGAALGFGALASSPVLATNRGHEADASSYGRVASGKRCRKTRGRHECRRTQKPKKPGSPSHPGVPAP